MCKHELKIYDPEFDVYWCPDCKEYLWDIDISSEKGGEDEIEMRRRLPERIRK